MKRNDIVYERKQEKQAYGRINRVIDEDTVEWIDCSSRVNIDKKSDLVVDNNYKGRWQTISCYKRDKNGEIIYPKNWNGDEILLLKGVFDRFIHMPTLRKLKQRASGYIGKNAWRLSKRSNQTTKG